MKNAQNQTIIHLFNVAKPSIVFIAQNIEIPIQIIRQSNMIIGLYLKGLAHFMFCFLKLKMMNKNVAKSNIAMRKCLKEVTSCIHKGGNNCNSIRKLICILTPMLFNFVLSIILQIYKKSNSYNN